MVAAKVAFLWVLLTVTSRSLGANVENRVTLGERPNDSRSQISRGPDDSGGQLTTRNDSEEVLVVVGKSLTLGELPNDSKSQISRGPDDSSGQLTTGNDREVSSVELADFVINSGDAEVYTKDWRDTIDLGIEGFSERLQCIQQNSGGLVCPCLDHTFVKYAVGELGITPERPHIRMHEIELLFVILLNHALLFHGACSDSKLKKFEQSYFYQVQEDQLRKALPVDDSVAGNPERLLEIVENVLREVKGVYKSDPSKNCFSAEIILTELHAVNATLPKVAAKIVAHMLKGECIDVGEALTDFMDDIFLHYGDRCNGVITPTAFEKLMTDLKTQGAEEHENHEVSINACDKDVEMTGAPRSTTQNYYSSEQYDLDGISKNEREKNSYTTRDLNTRRERSTAPLSSKAAEHEHKSLANKCLSAERLLQKFIMNSSENITPNDFLQLCPALVQQVVSGVCTNTKDSNTTKVKIKKRATAESYIYGLLAVFIISLTSISGVVAIPFLKNKYFKFVMVLFIGISFGTMTGDAIMHLMPQGLGLHGHDEEESNGKEHEGVSFAKMPQYIGIQFSILVVVYLLYLFESTSNLLFGKAENGHGHSHIPATISFGNPTVNHTNTSNQETEDSDSSDVPDTHHSNHEQSVDESPHTAANGNSRISDKLPVSIPMKTMNDHTSTPKKETSDSDSSHMQESSHSNNVQSTDELPHTSEVVTIPSNNVLVEDEPTEPKALIKSTKLFYGFTTMAIVIIFGDVMHNFADGIAVGAAFVPGLKGGISTAVAVFCHELPHELGDFALLMSTGLSYKQALTMNFLSALTSFFGFFLGVEYGADLTTRKWMMSATAGVFLYVALAEMIPELKAKEKEDAVLIYGIKHAGVLLGFIIMILIAIYEEHFHI